MSTVASGLAIADPVTIYWQESDLSSFPQAYATSLAKRIGVEFTGSATPASSSTLPRDTSSPEPSSRASSDKGLSTGVTAGISVATVAVVALVAIGAVLFLRRRKRQKKAQAHMRNEGPAAEMDQDQSHAIKKWFLGGKWRSEVAAQGSKHELDSRSVNEMPVPPAELDGSELHFRSEEDEGVVGMSHSRE
jgi:LPXTG-motif cell wall-anchored protein